MVDEPSVDELTRLGLYDPDAPDAEDRLELIRYAIGLGASLADIGAAQNLGELALDLKLRANRTTTLRQVVDEAGIDWASANRLLSATGFPIEPDAPITADEADTVRLLTTAATTLLGEDTAVQLARVAGSSMARIGEALVASFRLQFELPRRAQGVRYVDVVKEYADLAEVMLPAFMTSLDVMLRRTVVAVAERMWSTDEDLTTVTLPRTIGFADLVGYTEASASMTVYELATVLARFDEQAANIVLAGRGQIVKTIGDEILFVTEDPDDACAIALDLVAAFARGPLPPVRVGLALGDVVSVFGDVYGPAVNLAARLVAAADPSTVVVSEAVAAAVRGTGRALRPTPQLTLKGFNEPVSAFTLDA